MPTEIQRKKGNADGLFLLFVASYPFFLFHFSSHPCLCCLFPLHVFHQLWLWGCGVCGSVRADAGAHVLLLIPLCKGVFTGEEVLLWLGHKPELVGCKWLGCTGSRKRGAEEDMRHQPECHVEMWNKDCAFCRWDGKEIRSKGSDL